MATQARTFPSHVSHLPKPALPAVQKGRFRPAPFPVHAMEGLDPLMQASSTATLAPPAPAIPVEAPRGSRAVVIGSGLAGLAASRVLADLFDEVLLLERDSLQPNQVHNEAVAGSMMPFLSCHV